MAGSSVISGRFVGVLGALFSLSGSTDSHPVVGLVDFVEMRKTEPRRCAGESTLTVCEVVPTLSWRIPS